MKALKSNASLSRAMRHDLRRVERELSKLAVPAPADVLGLNRVRAELERLIGPLILNGADDQTITVIDDLVDAYIEEFLETLRRRHDARISSLDLLENRIRPYLAQARVMTSDGQSRLADLNAAVINALDQVSDPETPILDPRGGDFRGAEPKKEPEQ